MAITSANVRMSVRGELQCLEVSHPLGQAVIALQGAQVLSYSPAGAQPVIWLSEKAGYQVSQPVRGGIPLCWPWFADLARNPEAIRQQHAQQNAIAPAHGWARTVPWQVDAIEEGADRITISLSVDEATRRAAIFPVEVIPSVKISVGASLQVQLVNISVSRDPVMISQALHTYLAVSDIDNVVVEGLQAVPYVDTLHDWQVLSEASPVRIEGEVDRIYQGEVNQVSVYDCGWQRRVVVRSMNSRSLVLWNPHVEKSLRLSQFAADAWRHMLCIETANVLADVITLMPGQCHVLQLDLTLEQLN